MSEKHYTIDYLEDTARFLRDIKEFSYRPFSSIQEGTIVDLGCGTGIDVINLVALLENKVKVIGIDHDEQMIAKAKSSGFDIEQAEFMLSEVTAIPFKDASLNGVRAERLLQHLHQPDVVLSEIYRVMKSGQPLVIVETDWPGLIFYNEHSSIEKKLVNYLTDIKINNGHAARKLTKYLENAGFRSARLDVVPLIIHSLKEANEYLWIGKIMEEATQKGHLSAEEYSAFEQALSHTDTNGTFVCAINVVVASCVK